MSQLQAQLQATLGDTLTLERELGGGGMSHVFVATEKALGRQIVVKVLPLESGATVSAERFKREIMVAARLQHPHIVPVLSAGDSGGLPFYTMPFVKGESLRARLAKGGELSINETVHVLRDIASAIAYAHGEGVVHRDIKPENVILSGGVAVVTDFGIAKAMDASISGGGDATSGLTSLGVALGTPAYMAPEQATADPHVDHRADIYSFGCVAYELLAGSSPFAGRPPQQLLSAHVTETPQAISSRRPAVPPALAALVMKCLEKRAGDRPQSANELIAALDSIATPSGGTAPTSARLAAAPRARGRRRGLAVLAILVGAASISLWLRRTPFTPLQVGPTTPIAVGPELESDPAISPDGKLVAYVGDTPKGQRVFVRQIDGGGRANPVSGDTAGDQVAPRWSPDGSKISLVVRGDIYVVPALGGTPKKTVDNGLTHAWSPDGNTIAFERVGGLWIHAVADGAERKVVEGAFVHSPSWSPDGRFLAYAEGRRPTMNNVSTNVVWVVPVAGGTPVRVSDSTRTNTSPVWTPDGRSLLFVSSAGGIRDVYQQPMSNAGRPTGARQRLTTGLSAFAITLSSNGSRLAYDVVRNFSNVWSVAIDPSARADMSSARQITRENQHVEAMDVSRDGRWIAYDSDRGGNFDIYKMRIDGGDPIQLTNTPSNEFHPSWSPDDGAIAYHSQRSGIRHIYVMNADGSGEVQVTRGATQDYSRTWSLDGKYITFAAVKDGGDRSYRPMYVAKQGNGNWSGPMAVAPDSDEVGVGASVVSPDGTLIAYTRDGDLMVTARENGSPRVLASEQILGGPARDLAWPNGSTIYVSVGRDAVFRIAHIVAVSVPSGTTRMVLAANDAHHFGREEFATDGKRLFFTKAAWESDVGVVELTKRR